MRQSNKGAFYIILLAVKAQSAVHFACLVPLKTNQVNN